MSFSSYMTILYAATTRTTTTTPTPAPPLAVSCLPDLEARCAAVADAPPRVQGCPATKPRSSSRAAARRVAPLVIGRRGGSLGGDGAHWRGMGAVPSGGHGADNHVAAVAARAADHISRSGNGVHVDDVAPRATAPTSAIEDRLHPTPPGLIAWVVRAEGPQRGAAVGIPAGTAIRRRRRPHRRYSTARTPSGSPRGTR